MARRDLRPRWREAALGGFLLALGGALFGAVRGSDRPAGKASAPRPDAGRPGARGTAEVPETTERTQYWPPPPPKPAKAYDDGVNPPEKLDARKRKPIDRESERLGYERFDLKPGKVVTVMLGSALTIACCIAGLFAFVGIEHRDDRRAPPLTPQRLAVIVPPDPHLQDHPLHDIASENEREFGLLKYYAWTGSEHRSGRIPIARAMGLVTGRSLDPMPPATGPRP